MTKKRVILAILAAVLLLLFLFVYVWIPSSKGFMQRGLVLLQEKRMLVLALPDDKTLVIQEDSALRTGFFVDARGTIQTAPLDTLQMDTATVRQWLVEEEKHLQEQVDYLQHQEKEIAYYDNTHSPSDEGYSLVLELKDSLQQALVTTDSLLGLVELAMQCNFDAPQTIYQVTAIYHPFPKDSLMHLSCKVDRPADALLQLANEEMPDEAYVFNTTRLRLWSSSRYLLGYLTSCSHEADSLLSERIAYPDSLPPSAIGAPVVDGWGNVRGVQTGHGVQSMGGWSFSPRQWWHSLCQWWRLLFTRRPDFRTSTYGTQSNYTGHLCDSIPEGFGMQDGYSGQWRKGKRQGWGCYTDSAGVLYEGQWNADTLAYGRMQQGDTLYIGGFNAEMQCEGEGEMHTSLSYYQGHWLANARDGFGISLTPDKSVRAGVWHGNIFYGEQMLYNADRVYGIDISRYQHEIKRRRYGISWNNMRVTYLGSNKNRKVEGTANYPVSFVYMKATQGVRIASRYYASDRRAARRAGIAVGAYHFFSPTSGTLQARYFMKVARPQRGDLPPVLDLELTSRQITKMGGAGRMRAEVLAWLHYVQSCTGTKPVLYVSQNFLVKYIQGMSPALEAYPVWIARYSEFKPYMHLQYWQLCSDGRVRGITGPVDIDVFNGTHQQFQQYRQAEGVK